MKRVLNEGSEYVPVSKAFSPIIYCLDPDPDPDTKYG